MRYVGYFALALAVAAVLWFGWPTAYETYRFGTGVKRVNRWTGVEEVSSPTGWRKMPEPIVAGAKPPSAATQSTTSRRGAARR